MNPPAPAEEPARPAADTRQRHLRLPHLAGVQEDQRPRLAQVGHPPAKVLGSQPVAALQDQGRAPPGSARRGSCRDR